MVKSSVKKVEKKVVKHRFCIRKYVMATTAAEAMALDRKAPVHEVFVDDRQPQVSTTDAIGFEYEGQD